MVTFTTGVPASPPFRPEAIALNHQTPKHVLEVLIGCGGLEVFRLIRPPDLLQPLLGPRRVTRLASPPGHYDFFRRRDVGFAGLAGFRPRPIFFAIVLRKAA